MDLKPLAVLLLVLCSIVPVHAATVQDAGANMIQAGIDLVIRSLADGLKMFWQPAINNNFDNGTLENVSKGANVIQKYGETRASIMTFVSMNITPDKIEAVQAFEDKTTPVWLFLVLCYILIYPIRNILARAGYNTYIDNFGTPNLSTEKYIGSVILMAVSYATPNLVLLLIQFSTIASQYFMLNIMDYIEPSLGNAWLYLFMAIGEALLAIFFIIRPFAICIVYSVCKLLAIWFLSGMWRGEITWIWSRFFKILTLQPVVIFFTCICIIGIQWAHLDQSPGAYIAMFYLLFYICYKWLMGNFDLPGRLTRLAVRSAI
jgi:hypothetical protein